MELRRSRQRLALALVLAPLVFAACTAQNAGSPGGGASTSGGSRASKDDPDLSGVSGSVEVDGSSTVYLVTEAVAEEFLKATNRGVKVTVRTSGTGGGFKRFCRGEIDICDASRPILKSEMEIAREQKIEYIELPICFDALTVAVHPANKLTSITVAQLKKIWEPAAQSKITRWNQVDANWPDEELTLFGAGADSGTFDYFTEAIVGKAKASRGDFTASENDNVLVQGIAGNKHALGYLPYAYYEANKDKLKAVPVDWGKGAGSVLPSLDNVISGKYNPLSRPLFIYVNRKSADRAEVKAFVEFYLRQAAELATEVKYLPLEASAYEMGRERFRKLQTGTGFGGVPEVGIPVKEILERPPVQ